MEHQSEEGIQGHLAGPRCPGSPLSASTRDQILGWGAARGGGLCAVKIWVKDKYVPPSLLAVTNKPTHQRRIIKNNLHKLSVVGALF